MGATALTALSCGLASAVGPQTAAPFFGLLLIAVAAALFDAARGAARLRRSSVRLPPVYRCAMGRAGMLPVRVGGLAGHAKQVRLALDTPDELGSKPREIESRLPELPPVSSVEKTTPRPEAVVDWPCRPARRGRYLLALCGMEIESPWRFWEVRRRFPVACEVRVYPDLREERRRVAALFLRRGGGGIRRQRQVGKGREFEQLREYAAGDAYEDIHWKATARRQTPVTKVFQIERTQEVYVALDCSRLSGRPAPRAPDPRDPGAPVESLLDRTITAALTLALGAQQQGDRFGLITFDRGVRAFIRSGRGAAHFDACRQALYTAMPERVSPDFSELFSWIRTHLRRRVLLVVFTHLDQEAVAEQFERAANLVRKQHLLMVQTIRPTGAHPLFQGAAPESVEEIYRRLEGHEAWRVLEETARALAKHGIHCAASENERLSADVLAAYLRAKRRQML